MNAAQYFLFSFLAMLVSVPVVVHAAEDLGGVLMTINDIINTLIPIILGLAVLGFFWGLVRLLFSKGGSEERSDGIKILLLGILVIFVMVSLWGIIGVLQGTFGIQDTQPPVVPSRIGP